MTLGSQLQLARHLEQWLHAYGADLAVPAGTVRARPAPPAPPEPPDQPAQPEQPAPPKQIAEPVGAPTASAPPPAPPSEPERVAEGAAQQVPTASPMEPAEAALRALRAEVLPCTKCKLHRGRQQVVFGEGNPAARVMFVGEAPGAREDRTGRPFVGESGELLERILAGAMGLQRSAVYIANVNKCRPPSNRNPEADEVAACLPILRQQIEIVRPEVLVCLGRVAAQNLLGTTDSTRALRGRELSYAGIPVVVTWHPAYLLREPSRKRETWADIKRVNRLLGLPEVPPTAG